MLQEQSQIWEYYKMVFGVGTLDRFADCGLWRNNKSIDDYSKEPQNFMPPTREDDQPMEPICDIGINTINDTMFKERR
ncbi:hypothetical protein Ancab_006829 [Ancistrocladus abbreviatus]